MKEVNVINENKFDLQSINKYATIMALGNGYLGLRASHEENYSEQTRGMYVAGVYNKFTSNDVTEIVNLPDLIGMKIEINGEIFSVLTGEILSYERILNMQKGELTREVVWKNKDGNRFCLKFQRFVSKDNLHLLASKITVTTLDCDASIKITTGIDAQTSNFGKQHLLEENIRVIDKKVMHAVYTTTESNHTIALATTCNVPSTSDVSFVAKNRQLMAIIKQDITVDQPFELEKISAIYTSIDKVEEEPAQASIQAVQENRSAGYDRLLESSVNKWSHFWEQKRVSITSKEEIDQIAIDFSLYHIEIMTPSHDERFSVGAKGLTGEGYKGHVFWDTEIFIAPFHLFTEPEVARKLLTYRYLHIKEAKDKATKNGYEGALFPWESAYSGMEETPEYAAINILTGTRQKVASAIAEHHIVADIAFAVCQYYENTLDEVFMANEGLELLKETARFWISRTTDENEVLSINDVIGPDEYTEHINNNAYTNYMAYYNVQQALCYMEKYNKIEEDLVKSGNDFLNRLYLPKPNEDKIIQQDDTFLSKPEIDLSIYKQTQGSQAILFDYSRQEVNEMQILKQADVVMLLYLFPNLFEEDVVKKNLHYYEEHTIHDSSLSKAIHAIVAARCGEKENAYRLFQEACLIDLGPNPKSSDEGIHAASLGANWLATIFGFANITVEANKLKINPNLPKNWDKLSFPFHWQGTNLEISITQESVTVTKDTDTEVAIEINGELFNLINQITASL
ncbi:glycoside hydrolase family 65 protein [Bacillus sp. AFS053548]|uniref:glycoside hydrolase family 65 protein n=1 Tax=Bacillus sp. AFS053548 TaxID=2033505 RepID=UPI000BFD39A9|nr:glycoside hydrolase family 65 protein [Bacillus sp. AFS053548]PGM52079.1 glycosyl hydrolase family 65 [Bacillus sp. AFS053548]